MIYSLIEVSANDEYRKSTIERLRALRHRVLAAEGCRGFEILADAEFDQAGVVPVRPDVITILLRWESLHHYAAFRTSPLVLEFVNQNAQYHHGASIRVLKPEE
ncbi:hypothetical protein Pan216_21520 [Planctomycetes bacterium Pan216]|uniref:ABM domain-containing protein n=1 Tax=Kolteria novifilia TaxID=2527975 RepID=A0A518B2T9_9BACT|nr:hypothetical protein Pan216_21520 [Planctomycetes bacterium Pan216]